MAGAGGLDSDEECGLHGLGTDERPSKIIKQECDMTKQCLRKTKEATVHTMDVWRPEEGRHLRLSTYSGLGHQVP